MLEASDIVVSLVIGLAAPLAILDSGRLMLEDSRAGRESRQVERSRFLSWILALVAGPALFAERMIAEAKAGDLKGGQLALSGLALVSWSWLYGLALVGLLRHVHL